MKQLRYIINKETERIAQQSPVLGKTAVCIIVRAGTPLGVWELTQTQLRRFNDGKNVYLMAKKYDTVR